MAKQPLRSYQNQMMNYGIGKMFAENKPVTRGMMAEANSPDDPATYIDNIARILESGGLSGINEPVRNRLFNPLPKDIAEATKQVVQAGDTDSIFEPGTPSDFVPFVIPEGANVVVGKSVKPGTTTQSKGKLGSKVIPSQLEGGRGDVVEKPGERAGYFAQLAADKAISNKMDKDNAIEEAFKAGLDEYIKSARGAGPADTEMTIDDYKKEFADATGIDISGKVDKSQALMAFGLALMQNRAGKGFNVGRMLSEVGKAGEAAMPALQKAQETARTNALAAGKYALETRAADRAVDAANREKAMNRQGYYVFERGADMEDGNEKFKDGQIVYLNPEELNKLITNPDFEKNYSFIEKSEYIDVMKELTKPVELGDMWTKGEPSAFSLIGGDAKDVPPALQVLSHSRNANYEGETPSRRLLAEDEDDVKNRLTRYQQELAKNQVMLTELVENLQAGVSFPKQIAGKVQQLAKGLGLNVDTSTTAKAQQALKNIAIDNVLAILKESGRTISEGERQRVEKRVGEIALNLEGADLDLILNQVEYVYDMVVTKAQKNLDDALDSFESNFGYSIIPRITQDELDEINANRKAEGKEPLTMDDF